MTSQNMTSSHKDVKDLTTDTPIKMSQEHIDKIVDSIESTLPNLYTLQRECVDCLPYIQFLTKSDLPMDDDKLTRLLK